jgi:branched-chain amino acid transport system permease protein
VKEIAYLFIVLSLNDLTRVTLAASSQATETLNRLFKDLKEQVLTYVTPSFLILGFVFYMYVPHERLNFDHFKWLGIFLILYSFNPLTENISKAFEIAQRTLWSTIMPASQAQYGRSSERGSWLTFAFFLIILAYLAWWLPSVTNFTKSMQISRIIVLVCAFSILAFSLNLHTGITGMTNFGVIFFAGIGAITLGILTVPEDRPGGHGWSPIFGLLAAVIVSGVAGWLLAYPTARLRMDYFAIVTISLGEIVRISMRAEPLLRAGTGTTAIGIQLYELPLKDWWESTMDKSVGEWFNLTGTGAEVQEAPYTVLLAGIALISFFLIWTLVEMMLNSPWGRILRAIREDEEVTMHHGHDVFHHKATSLAVGAALAGFAGGLWAWLNMSILDDFINPVKSTFLIWAAFIVGGRANNRGMVIGAFIIVLTEFVFNLMVVARGDSDSIFHDNVAGIDAFFYWLLLDVVGSFNSDLSIIEPFGSLEPERIEMQLVYLKLVLIGLVITASLLLSERGLIPAVPKRPDNPVQSIQDSIDSGGGKE